MKIKFFSMAFLMLLIASASFSFGNVTPDINTILMRSTFKIAGEGAYGTAFILGKHSKSGPRYVLVTAAHVFSDIKGDHAILFLRKKIQEGVERLPHKIPIRKDGQPLWTKHPDADVAVMYVTLPQGIDILLASTNLLATNDILKRFELNPGKDVCALGYPFGKESNDSGFPILRSGKIASYPLVPVEDTKSFFIDLKIFSGNSGGPVYYHDPDWQKRGAPTIGHQQEVQILMGLVSRQVVVSEKVESNISMEYTVKNHQLGIAVVVHAEFIKEALEMLDKKQE